MTRYRNQGYQTGIPSIASLPDSSLRKLYPNCRSSYPHTKGYISTSESLNFRRNFTSLAIFYISSTTPSQKPSSISIDLENAVQLNHPSSQLRHHRFGSRIASQRYVYLSFRTEVPKADTTEDNVQVRDAAGLLIF